MIGATDLGRSESARVEDPPAVVMRTPLWEDYLALGVTEIRQYGASGIQVMRALRAMLEELREHVRSEHRAAVEEELGRLDSTVAARWGDSVDLDRAMVADGQGIGGPGSRRGPARSSSRARRARTSAGSEGPTTRGRTASRACGAVAPAP